VAIRAGVAWARSGSGSSGVRRSNRACIGAAWHGGQPQASHRQAGPSGRSRGAGWRCRPGTGRRVGPRGGRNASGLNASGRSALRLAASGVAVGAQPAARCCANCCEIRQPTQAVSPNGNQMHLRASRNAARFAPGGLGQRHARHRIRQVPHKFRQRPPLWHGGCSPSPVSRVKRSTDRLCQRRGSARGPLAGAPMSRSRRISP
jgi:hypothetical protein